METDRMKWYRGYRTYIVDTTFARSNLEDSNYRYMHIWGLQWLCFLSSL